MWWPIYWQNIGEGLHSVLCWMNKFHTWRYLSDVRKVWYLVHITAFLVLPVMQLLKSLQTFCSKSSTSDAWCGIHTDNLEAIWRAQFEEVREKALSARIACTACIKIPSFPIQKKNYIQFKKKKTQSCCYSYQMILKLLGFQCGEPLIWNNAVLEVAPNFHQAPQHPHPDSCLCQ